MTVLLIPVDPDHPAHTRVAVERAAALCAAAPQAVVIASHMEAVNHAMTTRAELRSYLAEHGLTARVMVPADGETIAI